MRGKRAGSREPGVRARGEVLGALGSRVRTCEKMVRALRSSVVSRRDGERARGSGRPPPRSRVVSRREGERVRGSGRRAPRSSVVSRRDREQVTGLGRRAPRSSVVSRRDGERVRGLGRRAPRSSVVSRREGERVRGSGRRPPRSSVVSRREGERATGLGRRPPRSSVVSRPDGERATGLGRRPPRSSVVSRRDRERVRGSGQRAPRSPVVSWRDQGPTGRSDRPTLRLGPQARRSSLRSDRLPRRSMRSVLRALTHRVRIGCALRRLRPQEFPAYALGAWITRYARQSARFRGRSIRLPVRSDRVGVPPRRITRQGVTEQ